MTYTNNTLTTIKNISNDNTDPTRAMCAQQVIANAKVYRETHLLSMRLAEAIRLNPTRAAEMVADMETSHEEMLDAVNARKAKAIDNIRYFANGIDIDLYDVLGASGSPSEPGIETL